MAKKITKWLHAILVLMVIPPLLYAMGEEQNHQVEITMYLNSLIIAIPVIGMDFIAEKVKYIWQYVSGAAALFILTGGVAYTLGMISHYDATKQGYVVIILLETILLITEKFLFRLNKKHEAENAFRSGKYAFYTKYHFLSKPDFLCLCYFFVLYLVAQKFGSAIVCNEMLINGVIYSICFFVFRFVDGTDHFFQLNEKVASFPKKRILGISKRMMGGFLLCILIAALPTLFTLDRRQYANVRQWIAQRPADMNDPIVQDETPPQETEEGEVEQQTEVDEEKQEIKEMPWLMKKIFGLIGLAIVGIFAVIFFKGMRRSSKEFRENLDEENGDIVEEIQPEQKKEKRVIKKLSATKVEGEKEKIRREYRNMIRMYRQDEIQNYETPHEIETEAGIVDEEKMRELHIKYEKARYGGNEKK